VRFDCLAHFEAVLCANWLLRRIVGRQHDVSECMDNCVFQIETALLKFDGLDESEEGKSSVVKRCVALGAVTFGGLYPIVVEQIVLWGLAATLGRASVRRLTGIVNPRKRKRLFHPSRQRVRRRIRSIRRS